MPGAAPAIDELRRRVEKDPTSIAFAHLAEELRRVGQYDEAVHVCRAGLERHPTYLSARVTLGRTLLALQQYGEARTEIEYVLRAAPDNLLALKCMNELQGLDGNTAAPAPEPARQSREAATAARPHDAPEPAEPNLRIQSVPEPAQPDLRVQTSPEPPTVEPPVAALASPKPQSGDGGPVAVPEPARVEPPVIAAPAPEVTALVEASSNGGPPAEHPAVAALEDWQARIQADRARQSGGSGPQDRPR